MVLSRGIPALSVDQDPLAILGPSIFLSIISHLDLPTLLAIPQLSKAYNNLYKAHASGIFRSACWRQGVESARMQALIEKERSGEGQESQLLSIFDNSVAPVVDWKLQLREQLTWDRNWRFGRCRDKWITGGGNAIWRFKLDEEQGTCLMTTRLGSLNVVDARTSQALLTIRGVRPYAHVEFCKGFAIFDVDAGDLTLEVYRTQNAIDRSSHPRPYGRPTGSHAAFSHTHPEWTPQQSSTDNTAQLPRGHLAFYRTISPSTRCRAFRARLDKEATDEERVVLCTAGEEAIYIWDLEDVGRVETILISEDERFPLNYVELDDEHVFLCSDVQMHIFSRALRRKVLSFPPSPIGRTGANICAVGYVFDEYQTNEATMPLVDVTPDPAAILGAEEPGPQSIVGRMCIGGTAYPCGPESPGWSVSEEDDPLMAHICGLLPRAPDGEGDDDEGRTDAKLEFSACHYTENDLFCTTRSEMIWIVRDYRSTLGIRDERERALEWAKRTIVVYLGSPVEHLSVDRTHVMVSTRWKVFFFDTSTLPAVPIDSPPHVSPSATSSTSSSTSENAAAEVEAEAEGDSVLAAVTPAPDHPFTMHCILSTHPYGLQEVSCAQMDRDRMYLTYWARGEVEAGNQRSMRERVVPSIPDRAQREFGLAIRAWDFSP